jgi:hypothetical protein
MVTTPPFQTESNTSAVSEQEPTLEKRLSVMAVLEQQTEQEKQQQLREDAEFKKQLDDKNLRELMQLQGQLREETENRASVLKAVKGEDMLAPTAYIKDRNEWAVLTVEDAHRIVAASREKHIRDDVPAALTTSFSPVMDGRDPSHQMEEMKKWLGETFPGKPTDALVVRDNVHGNYIVVSLGVSDYEITAARALQTDKRRFEEKSAEVMTRIQEKIKEGPQQSAARAPDQIATALATPSVRREPQELGPTHRS